MNCACAPWAVHEEDQSNPGGWNDIEAMWRDTPATDYPQTIPSELSPPSKTVELIGDGPPLVREPLPTLQGAKPDLKPALNETLMAHLFTVLPEECKIEKTWNLVYSTHQHGTSIKTLSYRMSNKEHLLFVVRTMSKDILGCYIAHPVKEENKRGYQGGGSMFVFSYHSGKFSQHTWTQANRYHVLFKPDGIGFGGDPNFALWLDESLQLGSTGYSKTYDNPPLSPTDDGKKTDFNVFSVEVWQVGPVGVVSHVQDISGSEKIAGGTGEMYDTYGYGGVTGSDLETFTDPLQTLQTEFAGVLAPEIVTEVFGAFHGDEDKCRKMLTELSGGESGNAAATGKEDPSGATTTATTTTATQEEAKTEECPVCGEAFPVTKLSDHVNAHFD
eukprot:NODE_139_length_1368_cov_536.520548_g135_i0.p1 GENE.NODE_139_length_1368_cov_536.520548_g135_i0~~NODE_139_length_1368_cov_536.520548_g135_i0.p1  ORF type:complete len:387 (+),score=101.21 NODE_139_length_1368_cov_536.520548_g135_i0:79-1239(+)